jgi:hypothetical protein
MSKAPALDKALSPLSNNPPKAAPVPPEKQRKSWVAPSREGKRAVVSYHEPVVLKQLQQMKLDLDRDSIQSLVEEALNDLFQKYRRPTIA